ncbi:MAG: chorismate synthase, partial [Sporichthyaceae bacterium]|nr:chorismate synthase [Sporichthyaceae bacterium]
MLRRLRLTTAGESHGPGLTAVLSGLPAGLRVDLELLARELARRQHGHSMRRPMERARTWRSGKSSVARTVASAWSRG